MAETLLKKVLPDIEDIVTEDDEPVDNIDIIGNKNYS